VLKSDLTELEFDPFDENYKDTMEELDDAVEYFKKTIHLDTRLPEKLRNIEVGGPATKTSDEDLVSQYDPYEEIKKKAGKSILKRRQLAGQYMD
jgi:hypothetical protein